MPLLAVTLAIDSIWLQCVLQFGAQVDIMAARFPGTDDNLTVIGATDHAQVQNLTVIGGQYIITGRL